MDNIEVIRKGVKMLNMEPKDSQIPEGFIDTSSNKHVLKPGEVFNVSKKTFNALQVSPLEMPLLDGIRRKLDDLIQQLQSQKIILTRPKIDENLEIPPEALEILREVLAYGADKYPGIKWWEEYTVWNIMHHAYLHIGKWLVEGKSYQINHAFTRLMMAAVIQHRNNLKQDGFS